MDGATARAPGAGQDGFVPSRLCRTQAAGRESQPATPGADVVPTRNSILLLRHIESVSTRGYRIPMPDVFTPAKRSDVRSRICAHGTTGWRRQRVIRTQCSTSNLERSKLSVGRLPAPSPCIQTSFVLNRKRRFSNSSFWQGCSKHGKKPKRNAALWQNRLAANVARDRRVNRRLRRDG
jgi:G:T-mismatch repair DNA endonuclease (very short patch repair protein)